MKTALAALGALLVLGAIGWGVWAFRAQGGELAAAKAELRVAAESVTVARAARVAASDTARVAVAAAHRARARTDALLAERAAAPHVGVVDTGHVVVHQPGDTGAGVVLAVPPQVVAQLARDSTLIASLLFERDTAYRAIARLEAVVAADSTERAKVEGHALVMAEVWRREREALVRSNRKWKVVSAGLALVAAFK